MSLSKGPPFVWANLGTTGQELRSASRVRHNTRNFEKSLDKRSEWSYI